MVVGLLASATVATPYLRATAWTTLLAAAPAFVVTSVLFHWSLRPMDTGFAVIKGAIYVALPSMVVSGLIINGVGELTRSYLLAQLVVVLGGAAIGTALMYLVGWRTRARAGRR